MNTKNKNQILLASFAMLVSIIFAGCSKNIENNSDKEILNDSQDDVQNDSGSGTGDGENNPGDNGNTAGDGRDDADNTAADGINGEDSNADKEDVSLEEIVEILYEKADVPPYETVTLDKSNFEYFAFIPYSDDLTAVAADALVNITPHSMVVIHSEKGDGTALAESIAANADLNKWLCVGSEAGSVVYTDHYVVLVMSDRAMVDAVTENFDKLSERLDGMKMSQLSMTNSRYE